MLKQPRIQSSYLSAALVVAIILSVAGSAGITAVIDQSFATNNPDLGAALNDGYIYTSQTTFASIPGYLTRVDLYFGRSSDEIFPWLVTINALDASGVPTSTVLASQVIDASTVPTSSGYNVPPAIVDFSAPAHLSAGTGFGITLSIVNGMGHTVGGGGVWSGRSGYEYPGGSFYFSNNGANFAYYTGDLYFTTYMDSVPEPAALSLVAAGALWLRPRRKR